MAKQSMCDWQSDILKKDLPKLAKAFNINRQDDIKRLKSSGLPYFHNFVTDYANFSQENLDLMQFFLDNNEFMVRILPKKFAKGFPRTYKRGNLFTFENCKEFLDFTFNQNSDYKNKQEFYDIYLAETEVNRAGGVILSNIEGVRMEIKKESKKKKDTGLSGLCYGDIPDQGMIVDLTGIGHVDDKTIWTYENKTKLNKVMKRALKHIQFPGKDNFNPHFMRGYFEFLHTASDRIVFWDYKNQDFFQK